VENDGESMYRNISPQEFLENPSRFYAIDVRTEREWEWVHDEHAIHIPLPVLAQNISNFPKDKPVLFICRTGGRSLRAAKMAGELGYEAYNLAGGMLMLLEEKAKKGIISKEECERLLRGL
jgi:rhodanese-related sulfurtransferase